MSLEKKTMFYYKFHPLYMTRERESEWSLATQQQPLIQNAPTSSHRHSHTSLVRSWCVF